MRVATTRPRQCNIEHKALAQRTSTKATPGKEELNCFIQEGRANHAHSSLFRPFTVFVLNTFLFLSYTLVFSRCSAQGPVADAAVRSFL